MHRKLSVGFLPFLCQSPPSLPLCGISLASSSIPPLAGCCTAVFKTNATPLVLHRTQVAFEVLGIPLIYLIMAASCALFAALCLETYGLRVREVNATVFEEKMNLRGR